MGIRYIKLLKSNKVYLLFLLNVISNFTFSQNYVIYEKEVAVSVGMSVPTMSSREFKYRPESLIYKVLVTRLCSKHAGFASGLQLNTIANFREIGFPLLITYRNNPKRVTIPGTYIITIPMVVSLSAGVNFGAVIGQSDNDLKLNNRFVTSLIVDARFCYLIGSFSFFLNPELNILLTKNYSFKISNKYVNPLSYFKGSFGISYLF